MPVAFEIDIDKETKLAVWEITETKNQLYAMILNGLKQDKHQPENIHWLASRALFSKMFNGEHIILYKNKQNKPFIVVNNLPFFTSITHSNNYAAVMTSKTYRLGIDLEKTHERIIRVSRKFMNEQEHKFAKSIVEKTIIWSAKETLFKLHYKGGIDFKYHLNIYPFKAKNKGLITGEIEFDETNLLCNIHYLVFKNMVLTYCYKNIYE